MGSSILNKLIPFFLLPILTDHLAPEEYGVWSIYQLMISFFSAFIGMAIHTNISKNFFKYSKDQLSLMIGNILIVLLISTTILFTLTLSVSFFKTEVFSVPTSWVLIIPFISFMLMINTINLTILRNENKVLMFGIFEIVNTAINMGVALLLLLVYSFGWHSLVLGIVVAYFIFFFISMTYMIKNDYITFNYNKEAVNKILKLSLPLIPHVIGGIVIALSDRFFIEKMIDLKTVGIYSVGYMFGMVVSLFTDAFIRAWSPWFYKTLLGGEKAKKRKIVKFSYLYIIATFCVAFGVSIFANLILPYMVDEKYRGAEKYVFWVAIGYAIHGVYKIFFPYLVHLNKTAFLGISTVIAAILNLIFNYFLIKEFGAIGAAYATALAFAVSAALVFWYQNKHFSMPWRLK